MTVCEAAGRGGVRLIKDGQMTMGIFRIAAGAVAASSLAAAAIADDHSAAKSKGWAVVDMKPTNGDAPATDAEAIVMASTETPALMFVCANETLSAIMGLQPMDLMAVSTKDTGGRWRPRSILMTRGEDEPLRSKWRWNGQRNIAQPATKKVSARLYNAAIRGETVTIKMGGLAPVTVTPAPVDDTFRAFGAKCGLGAQKDASS